VRQSWYRARLTDSNLAIADRVNEVAAARGATPAQVAIAWLRSRGDQAAIVPILGARRREQIEDSLGALAVELTPDERQQLDDVSRIPLGFPHDFAGMRLPYGDTYELIDDGRPAPGPVPPAALR
jgi:aryl-alcohol dehydrogenase-like predicted oxidoreductase